jgi:hypothetical protein
LLSTPEERARRLNEEPEIHADPAMDPYYESPEEQEQEIERSILPPIVSSSDIIITTLT